MKGAANGYLAIEAMPVPVGTLVSTGGRLWAVALAGGVGLASLAVLPATPGFADVSPELAVQRLIPSDGAAQDFFGNEVSLDGGSLLVGAWGDDHAGGIDAGSAYVFVRSGLFWEEQTKFTTTDSPANQFFGALVAISGDTALVAAYRDDTVATDAGSAYVFTRNGPTWSQQAKLMADDASAFDFLAINLDLQGDTAVLGAHQDDNERGANAGAAYVYARSGSAWGQQAKLTASDGNPEDYFGVVAMSGETLVVGARFHDVGGNPNAGAVYVYVRDAATWTQQVKLTAHDPSAGDNFGTTLAMDGDLLAVAAPADDNQRGSVYVFRRSGSVWTLEAKLTAPDRLPGDRFGDSVSVSAGQIVVGASRADVAGLADAGSAYLFKKVGASWLPGIKMVAPIPLSDARFGNSVWLDEGTLAVSAYHEDTLAGERAGAVYVFELLAPVAIIAPVSPLVCIDGEGTVTLDGTASYSQRGLPLTYQWSAPGVALDDPSSPTPTGDFPFGLTTVTLTVTDQLSDSDTESVLVVDTVPPVVDILRPLPGYLYVNDAAVQHDRPTLPITALGRLTIKADAVDTCAVAYVRFNLPGGLYAIDTAPPYEFVYDVSVRDSRSVTIGTLSIDRAGLGALAEVRFLHAGLQP